LELFALPGPAPGRVVHLAVKGFSKNDGIHRHEINPGLAGTGRIRKDRRRFWTFPKRGGFMSHHILCLRCVNRISNNWLIETAFQHMHGNKKSNFGLNCLYCGYCGRFISFWEIEGQLKEQEQLPMVFARLFSPNIDRLKKNRNIKGLIHIMNHGGSFSDKGEYLNAEIRGKAALALSEIIPGDYQVVRSLIDALPKWEFAQTALIGMGMVVVDPLIEVLSKDTEYGDKEGETRRNLVMAILGEIGEPKAVRHLFKHWYKSSAEKAIIKIGKRSIPELEEIIKTNTQEDEKRAAGRLISKINEPKK
jgi:hypothetical protein